MSVKQRLRDLLYEFVALLPPPRGGVILMYHSISYAKHYGTVTPENFKAQMDILARKGFDVVSLDDLSKLRKDRRVPPKTVAITFDDGYRDNYQVAFPILKEHGFPATIFVITDDIGSTRETRGETFNMLSENDIRELADSALISLEPHTATHPKLTKIDVEDIEQEILVSKERLEAIIGKTCQHFAYPYGRHDAQAEDAALHAGISYAYTTRDGFVQMNDTENLRLRRNGMNRTVTLPQFIGIATWGKLTRARYGV